MARPTSETLTARESQIMDALWTLGQATAEEVRAALGGESHDSTVRTLLRVLETKGYVVHEARGKAYVYHAAVPRAKAQQHAVRDVLARFFGGSAADLVLTLIEDEHLTPQQLEQLRDAATETPPKRRRRESR